mmetsp:Transcript_28177/g.87322  ORF Transcript_28177/g.87322 Transcript_28177/m.87322 type:complete len:209 (-) Transcript_28177:549-1175(-)
MRGWPSCLRRWRWRWNSMAKKQRPPPADRSSVAASRWPGALSPSPPACRRPWPAGSGVVPWAEPSSAGRASCSPSSPPCAAARPPAPTHPLGVPDCGHRPPLPPSAPSPTARTARRNPLAVAMLRTRRQTVAVADDPLGADGDGTAFAAAALRAQKASRRAGCATAAAAAPATARDPGSAAACSQHATRALPPARRRARGRGSATGRR